MSNVIAIAGGGYHTTALKSDGTVWAWGSNDYGQLGDGTNTNIGVPIQVNGLSSVSKVVCGYWHSVALKSDGSVWAWGGNGYGQLGDGTTTNRTLPTHITGSCGGTAI